jgi:hypothetical protein
MWLLTWARPWLGVGVGEAAEQELTSGAYEWAHAGEVGALCLVVQAVEQGRVEHDCEAAKLPGASLHSLRATQIDSRRLRELDCAAVLGNRSEHVRVP